MVDTSGIESAATMEKLELLSATAILKQGIDGAQEDIDMNYKVTVHNNDTNHRILETPSFGASNVLSSNSPSSVTSTISRPIFSVSSTTSVSGLLIQRASSPAVADIDGSKLHNASHLASPVSTDGEDDVHGKSRKNKGSMAINNLSESGTKTVTPSLLHASVSSHSLQQIIESRSPLLSSAQRQQVFVDGPSSPPASNGAYSLQPRYEASTFRPPGGGASNSCDMEHSAFRSFAGSSLGPTIHDGGVTNFAPVGVADTGYYPHQRQHQLPSPYSQSSVVTLNEGESYEHIARELVFLREQLKEKDLVVSSLQYRVNYLENKINELKQLPTGKISHIPVE